MTERDESDYRSNYQSFIWGENESSDREEQTTGSNHEDSVGVMRTSAGGRITTFGDVWPSVVPGLNAVRRRSPEAHPVTPTRAPNMQSRKGPALNWTTDEREYRAHASSYWPMPNEFVTAGHLARLWSFDGNEARRSASAGISALPVIGAYMNTSGQFLAGHAKLARLAGISVRSVSDVARALASTGIGTHRVARRANATSVSEWKLSRVAYHATRRGEHVISTYDAATQQGGYFDFQSAAVYGGNWQAMSPVQRLIYLAVGAHVRTFESSESAESLLRANLTDSKAIDAILAREGRLLFAFLSYSQLAQFTGASKSSLSRAVAALPSLPFPTELPARSIRASLMATAPTVAGGSNLYVLFDDFSPVCGTVPRRPLRSRSQS
jgi:hypothetical protein